MIPVTFPHTTCCSRILSLFSPKFDYFSSPFSNLLLKLCIIFSSSLLLNVFTKKMLPFILSLHQKIIFNSCLESKISGQQAEFPPKPHFDLLRSILNNLKYHFCSRRQCRFLVCSHDIALLSLCS